MSSQKTEHYQLHQWQPSDEVLREEFNENFGKLDACAKIVFGSFAGDSAITERFIDLGETPKVVVLATQEGMMGFDRSSINVYGGIFTADFPLVKGSTVAAQVVEGGFQIRYDTSVAIYINSANRKVGYLAIY